MSFLEIVQAQMASNDTCLPPFDTTAQQIRQEIMKEDPDVQLIEKLIVRDQAITSQVLRVANSSFYKGLVKASTVRNAILRLGINEVSNMVTMVTMEKSFRSKDPFINGVLNELWRHSVGCGFGAHWLAKKGGFQSLAHEVFFAGLLHDVGKLFILAVVEKIRRSGNIAQQPSNALLDEVMRSMHSDYGHTMDLTIPGGMGGKETIKKLLAYDPAAIAIVSSGYSNDPIMSNCEAYGFKGVIKKPYRIEELSDVLRDIFSRKR